MELTWLDFTTYFIQNFCEVLAIFVALIFICFILSFAIFGMANVSAKKGLKILLIESVIIPFISLLGFVPTHDNILKLKITKIKNEAVSSENLKKGEELLTKAIKKLECKYLNECEKE